MIGDWNEECIGQSNSKKLCNEFGMVNIFHGKYQNHEKFKTYHKGFMLIDYGLIHQDLIDKRDQVTYKPFGYRKGKGAHRGWYLDILETDLFGNKIDEVYQLNGRSLHSKDSKQSLVYLKTVDMYLTEHRIYQCIAKLMKSNRSVTKKAEAIDEEITQATQYGKTIM